MLKMNSNIIFMYRLPIFRHASPYVPGGMTAHQPQVSCNMGEFMNNNLKYGLFFLGGVALGAIGAVAVSRGKLDIKPLATDLISRGLEVKDAVLAKADAVREDMEDMVAEARAASEQRKAHVEEA
jgi:hypothetical protein